MRRIVVSCIVLFASMIAIPAYAAPVRYEAENATCTGTIDANHAGFSGSGFCNGSNAAGAFLHFAVSGSGLLSVRYANGATAGRPATLIVNGSTVSTLAFGPTGSWTAWTTVTVNLAVAATTIRLSPATSAGLPNVDFIELDSAGTPPPGSPNPLPISGSTGAHDPTVVKTPSGTYIVAVTGNNLPLKTSANRTSWSNAGVVWPGGASWTTAYTNGSAALWAPDLSYRNGQYYLYYSASTFGSQRSAIFLATSPTAASGTWTHRGLVIESSTSVNYNAIDPNLFVDPSGAWWLTFGSFWTGIKQIRLDPATGLRSTSDATIRAVSQRTTASGSVEAPTVHRRGDFYYLFVSFDFCCRGAQSTYRVMVGRSSSVNGPYTDRNGVAMTGGGGTQVLAGHGSIHGPGHQAVLSDGGADYLFYHYYADNGASFLGINNLGWDSSGWPYLY